MDFESAVATLQGSHDLRLSAWGPYTKRYIGVSHIPDIQSGLRFDLSVFPGLYRRAPSVPNVQWECGYHPWEAAPDLSYYRHRHEVVWKDQVYADIDYFRAPALWSGDHMLVRIRCVNASDAPENLVLHWVASLHLPTEEGARRSPLVPARVTLPAGSVWKEGMDYAVLSLGHEAHRANLVYDGHLRGEVRVCGFVSGQGLGHGFGLSEGDAVIYRVQLPGPIADALLVLRYRLPDRAEVKLDFPGLTPRGVRLRGTGEVAVREIALDRTLSGEVIVTVVPADHGVPLELDGFALVPRRALDELRFEQSDPTYAPKRLPGPRHDTLLLMYEGMPMTYGLAWGAQDGRDIPFQIRDLHCDDLDTTLRQTVHHHTQLTLFGPGEGHFTDVFQRPIFLEPGSDRVITGLVCCGEPKSVYSRVAAFDPSAPELQRLHDAARSRAFFVADGQPDANPSGEAYRSGQARMAATVLCNVVYPVRTRGTWIRHYTPGRWWDSLYTWDSGFIGLGLAELDPDRAVDTLNAYLTAQDTEDAAFIHHGSLVPTQFYLFLELWNRTQSPSLLQYFYPRLRQYHRFLAGRLGSSTTRTLRSGLIRPWDYFYNSGGWDDYPPQVHVHRYGLQQTVAPVISTAQVIRTARILTMAALALGEPTGEYEDDIAHLSNALQAYAWDDEAGYFGYVVHTDQGWPVEILRYEDGSNYNMGMDGATPLVAGVCTPAQETRLLKLLMSDAHLWTRFGLTAVDQSAPYYSTDGYWNGTVWMAHQWFFWKALLDLGCADEAHQIASTALEVWQQEVDRSYNCFEHFTAATGRGAGWHHFGGLSTPVLSWFAAYHRPGRVTTGLDTWVEDLDVASARDGLRIRLCHTGQAHHSPVVIVTLVPGDYSAKWNGVPIAAHARYPGTLEITLPQGVEEGVLEVGAAPHATR